MEKVEIGNATLYRADCMEVLLGIKDVSIDAIITDPPYCSGGVSEASRSSAKAQGIRPETLSRFGWFVGDNMGTAGLLFLLRQIAWEGQRVIKPSGSMLMFCDWRMLPNIAPMIESVGFRYQNLVVWDKGSMGLGNGFRTQHELIMHFTNGSPEYFSRSASNVIKEKRIAPKDRKHQTQKPIDLMLKLIKVVTPPCGVILDPFMGSGSTGVACVNDKYQFIGIERDPRYFEIACRRIEEAQRTAE